MAVLPAEAPAPPLRPAAELGDLRRDFAYRDRELLRAGQRRGGRLFVPARARRSTEPLPTLVVLHGLNLGGDLHKLISDSSDDDYDVTRVVNRLIAQGRIGPLVVAAPTQTVRAWNGRMLWTEFDLGDFLDAVSAHLPPGLKLDRRRVIVAAHSAAGCNPKGGLFHIVKSYRQPLLALGSVDTCMTPSLAKVVRKHLSPEVPFIAVWQRGWPRRFRAFEKALGVTEGEDAPPSLAAGFVRQLRRAGAWISAELATDEASYFGNHLDAITRFVEMVLPVYLPGPAGGAAVAGPPSRENGKGKEAAPPPAADRPAPATPAAGR